MLVLTTTTEQAVAVGRPIIFDRVALVTGKCNCNSANVARLARIGNGVHRVSFHGNIASESATTEVELSIAFDGVADPAARAVTTSVAAGDINNVGMETVTKICCCECSCDTISVSVINTGAGSVTVEPGSTIIIERVG